MAAGSRDVVFVDGVRTPFGKAGPTGLYAQTRADDLVVRCIRELLRRNPQLPPERIDDVAVAATTQTGDQGLTIGRSAALLAGLPRSVPGYAIDRMCAGAMTAVTTTAGGDRLRRLRRRHRRRGRAHGPPPDGQRRRPEPALRRRAARRPDRARDGQRPRRTCTTASRTSPASAPTRSPCQPGADRQGVRRRHDPAGPGPRRDPLGRAGLGATPPPTSRRGPAPRSRRWPALHDPVPPARPGDRRQRRRPQRRRHRVPARRRGRRRRARPAQAHAPGDVRVRRRRARGDGRRTGPGHREGAGQGRADHRRHRPLRGQRGVRGAGAGLPRPLRHRRRRPAGQPAAAARSPSATRSPRRACG